MADVQTIEDNKISEPAANRLSFTPRKQKVHPYIGITILVVFLTVGAIAGIIIGTKVNATGTVGQLTPGQKALVEKKPYIKPLTSAKPEEIRDSSTGIIQAKPEKEIKKQGTHILKRDDAPWPIYLVSSTVDLNAYIGKHVKIYGVTYNGGSSDWFMTVNKIDEK